VRNEASAAVSASAGAFVFYMRKIEEVSMSFGFGSSAVAGALFLVAAAVFVTCWCEKNRAIVAAAAAALRGQVKLENGKLVCARDHVEAGKVALKKAEYDGLVRSSNELTFSLGYITRAEKMPYPDAVAMVIDGQ
jgi:hypothetical protein